MTKQSINRSRRIFLKYGIKGIAGAVLLPMVVNKRLTPEKDLKKNTIIYRNLGRTGKKLSIIGLGGPEHPELITTGLEKGINHINTSPEYRRGNQETMIGTTLKGIPRDSYIIATGFSMWRRPKDQIKHYTKEMIINSFEASLKRLDLDYVDIYYLLGVAKREGTYVYESITILTLHRWILTLKACKTRISKRGQHARSPQESEPFFT